MRERKLTGAAFAQGLVFAQLAHSQVTGQQTHQKVVYAGSPLTCQALDQRFTPQAEAFLRQLLSEALCQHIQSGESVPSPSLLQRFQGVYIVDSTRVSPSSKLLTYLNLTTAELAVELAPADRHDNAIPLAHTPLPSGALRLADLGFFDLQAFAAYAQDGCFWLSRYKAHTQLLHPDTYQPLDIMHLLTTSDSLYCPVLVGKSAQVSAYLVVRRVDPAQAASRQERRAYRAQRKQQSVSPATLALAKWDIYLTNIPDLSVDAICALAHARWQIEIVFKCWKSALGLTALPTTRNPHRQACLFYAKLLAVWVAHCLLTLDPHPNRSWWQAFLTLRDHAVTAIYALASPSAWRCFLLSLQSVLPSISRMSKRRKVPLTFQSLLL